MLFTVRLWSVYSPGTVPVLGQNKTEIKKYTKNLNQPKKIIFIAVSEFPHLFAKKKKKKA